MGSVNEGTGENGRQLRKELEAVLMSRLDAVYSDEGCYEMKRSIVDGLVDLIQRKNLPEIVGPLEICGVLSYPEALHFSGVEPRRQAIEEATGLLQPLRTTYNVFSFSRDWSNVDRIIT